MKKEVEQTKPLTDPIHDFSEEEDLARFEKHVRSKGEGSLTIKRGPIGKK